MQPLPNGSWTGLNAYEALQQVRYIASILGITLGSEPTEDEIQKVLFPMLGQGKVYAANAAKIDPGFDIYRNLDLLDALEMLLVSVPLRSVHGLGKPQGPVAMLITGATASWMERRCFEATAVLRSKTIEVTEVYLLAGSRIVDDKAGRNNFHYESFLCGHGLVPSEWQLLARIFNSITGGWHGQLINDSNDLDMNVARLALLRPEIADGCIYVPTNAGALNVPLQVRRKLREIFPDFDADPDRPQMFFSADGFNIARSADQAAEPMEYQSPLTLLSALPRLVNELYMLKA